MTKQKKQLLVLLIFLMFLVITYWGIGYYNERQVEKEAEDIVYITDFTWEEVSGISYDYNDITYSFVKKDESWIYEGDTSLDLDESLIESTFSVIANLKTEQELTEYEALETYGLDTPAKTISITLKDGQIFTLLVGDYNSMVDWYYLMLKGGNTLYMVDSTIYDTFEGTYEDFIVVEEIETTEVTEE